MAVVAASVIPALMSENVAFASNQVHPDCADHAKPVKCSKIVATLEAEVETMLQAYIDGDVQGIISFFDPGAVTMGFDQFYRGSSAYLDGFLGPMLASGVCSFEFIPYNRWQVISPDLVVWYGLIDAGVTTNQGETQSLTERVMIVWTRNPGDPDRPFLMAASYYEPL